MADIKATVHHRITEEDYKEVEKVTGPVVKIAATSMKKAKPDVSTSYTSDAIRNAPDSLYDHLASVFWSWIIHGTYKAYKASTGMRLHAPHQKPFEKSGRDKILSSHCG